MVVVAVGRTGRRTSCGDCDADASCPFDAVRRGSAAALSIRDAAGDGEADRGEHDEAEQQPGAKRHGAQPSGGVRNV